MQVIGSCLERGLKVDGSLGEKLESGFSEERGVKGALLSSDLV